MKIAIQLLEYPIPAAAALHKNRQVLISQSKRPQKNLNIKKSKKKRIKTSEKEHLNKKGKQISNK